MKKLVALILLLTACATQPKMPFSVDVAAVDAILATLNFENYGQQTYYGYVSATVPFSRGQWPSGKVMQAKSEDGEIVDFLPIKWFLKDGNKEGVALAKAIFKAKLPAGRRTIRILSGDTAPKAFTFGSELAQYVANGTVNQMIGASYTAPGGTPCYASAAEGAFEFLQTSATRTVLRVRTHPSCAGVINNNISFTFYWELLSGQNHGTFYAVVGNDTLEAPVQGGLQIQSVDLLVKPPFEMGLFYPSGWAFGGVTNQMGYRAFRLLTNQTIGDGQTFAIKGRWGVFSAATQTERNWFLIAANESPILEIIGTPALTDSVASKAFGPTGVIPVPRSTETAQRQAVAHHCTDMTSAQPAGYLGSINIRPPSTGAQPAFQSGFSIRAQQILHAQSMCPARAELLAVMKESWRPSYYWHTPTGGVERPVESADFPDAFFWSSRIHYAWSWQQGKPYMAIWQNRIGNFQPGPWQGWEPYDNQHYEFSPIRSLYELTGDVYLGEIINYNKTIQFWNFFTGRYSGLGWFNTPEADRAYGRLGKESAQSFEYFPDTTPLLKDNLNAKMALVGRPIVQNNRNAKGFAYLSFFNPDGRVQLTQDCLAGNFVSQGVQPSQVNCRVVVGWQTGFFLELLAQQIKNGQNKTDALAVGQLFMDSADKYIDPTGNGVTYFLIENPSIRTFGGIGIWWWSGWLNLAKYYPNHPKQNLITALQNQITASMNSAPTIDSHWRNQDDWRSF